MKKMGPISGQAITLANSIIGVGILAMPFCFQQCGIILSVVLLLLSGFMSRLASHFLLKSAIKSRRRNFEVLAFHVFGNAGKFCVEIGIIGFLMGTCIAYFVVVGDLGPQIIAKMFSMNQSNNLRTGVMVMVSLFCVLPLGLLKNVDSLSNVCAVTIGFYFCLVIKIVTEATSQMLTGEWVYNVEYWKSDGVLRCLPIFSMSLFCQTQLFEIYDTLPNASLEKMNTVTKNAVTICSVVYILVGYFGYIAFANQPILGNILTNLSPTMMSDVIKLGFVMSLAFSFPLIIFPCRVSLYSLLYKKGQVAPHDLMSNMMPDSRFKYLTVFIIGTTLIISLMLPNIELVLGFVGSTIGVIVCVIFPAMCFICISIKNTNERILAQIVLCFGIIIMVLGTYANLQATEMDNINMKYKMEHSLEIKHNLFINENIKNNINIEKVEVHKERKTKEAQINNKKDSLKPIIAKVDEKKESRLEPPNPVAPKEDVARNSKPDQLNKLNVKNNTVIHKVESDIHKIESDIHKVELEIHKVEPEVNKIESDIHKVEPEIHKDNLPLNTENIVKDVKTVTEAILNHSVSLDNIKSDEMKKEGLMETIKRHEKEQREIMLEQREILKEMKKTKKEIEEENLLKKVGGGNINEVENKKIAMENIQKLAKIAIESLGGKLDISEKLTEEKTTKKSIEPIDNKNNESVKKVLNISGNNLKPSDFPSDKNEVTKNAVINNNKLSDKLTEKLIEKPPIPIVLLKSKKDIEVKNYSKEEIKEIESSNTEQKIEDSHIGGKRDILEIDLRENSEDSNIFSKTRHKRDISNCVDQHVLK